MLNHYQLFLFDFDGLLVDTEKFHWKAYRQMCVNRGFELRWSFSQYCQIAHRGSDFLRAQIFLELPELQKQDPKFEALYMEKQTLVNQFYRDMPVELMAGVELLLRALEESGCKRCVVTNSSKKQVEMILAQQPILGSIPHWMTREKYDQPKPHPECYLKAIKELVAPGDRIVGFEDTPRGIQALMATPAQPVMVTDHPYSEMADFERRGVLHLKSLLEILP